jgi:NADH-quinone oxidoreductase subunit A
MELSEYLPILLLAALALLFAVGSLTVSSLLRPNAPNPAKLGPYESGIEPQSLPAGERFHVKFYVVAMLFIVFDIETIFLFAWAVAARALGAFGLVAVGLFIVLLFVVEAYVWLAGAFDWERDERERARLALHRPSEFEDEEPIRAG